MAGQPKALVVDDDASSRITIEAMLSSEDYELHFAENGAQALSMAAELRPDIILLDLNMPRKSGLEVLIELKSDLDFKRIPVIVYTSSVTKEDIKAAYNHHANSYIRKSVDFDDCIKTAKSIKDFWFTSSVLSEP